MTDRRTGLRRALPVGGSPSTSRGHRAAGRLAESWRKLARGVAENAATASSHELVTTHRAVLETRGGTKAFLSLALGATERPLTTVLGGTSSRVTDVIVAAPRPPGSPGSAAPVAGLRVPQTPGPALLTQVTVDRLVDAVDEHVSLHTPAVDVDDQDLLTTVAEIALLRGLLRATPGRRYLEYGPLRSTRLAQLRPVAKDVTSVGWELPRLGSIATDDAVPTTGRTPPSPDVVFVDCRVLTQDELTRVTRSAFEHFAAGASHLVWGGVVDADGRPDPDLLAAIGQGAPGQAVGHLRAVSGTGAVIFHPAPRQRPPDDGAASRSGRVTFAPSGAARDLVILDDGFPSLRSPFRIFEYNDYLQRWPTSAAYTTGGVFDSLLDPGGFDSVHAAYARKYPRLADQVHRMDRPLDLRGDAAYFMFVNNGRVFLPEIERTATPFAFTLYPGGGFRLEQKSSDEMLRRLCSARGFRRVIATQGVTARYLVERGFCAPEQVELIYGGVFPPFHTGSGQVRRRLLEQDKDTFDICFVAYKYAPASVRSKGFDVFAATAQRLAPLLPEARFHVVGNFDAKDADVSGLEDVLEFYGPRLTEFFPAFYASMDIILAPNEAFALQPGAFDGFPTGACIEAGLSGVAVFASDPLQSNPDFVDGQDIVLIDRDPETVAGQVLRWREHYEDLRRVADRGRARFGAVFDLEAQLAPRRRVIEDLLTHP